MVGTCGRVHPRRLWKSGPTGCRCVFGGYGSGEVLNDFPALLMLHEGLEGFSYDRFASAEAHDLRLADAQGERLSFEIETWDSNGVSCVWVKVPRLTNGGRCSGLLGI